MAFAMDPAEAGKMFLPDALQILETWGRHPPLHRLVAGFIGFKPQSSGGAVPEIDRPLDEILANPPDWCRDMRAAS